jgi:DNA-binding CsgD family transcriptional regulator
MEQRLACGQELIALGDQTGMEVFACVGRQQMWWCHRELGNRDEMDRWYESAAERIVGPDFEQIAHAASVALMDGDLARAERFTVELAEFPDSVDVGRIYAEPLRDAILDFRGRIPDPDRSERLLAAWPSWPRHADASVALARARGGDLTGAQKMLDHAIQRGFSPTYTGYTWTQSICCWAEIAAIVADSSAAGDLRALLAPLGGRLVDVGVLVSDTIDRARALIELAMGDPATAADIAASAVAASRRRRTHLFLGRELVVLAAAQRRLGVADGNHPGPLQEALAIARRTGARIIVHDAALYLEGTPIRHTRGHSELTSRERDVIDLVAAGATNAQIGSALGISPATVRKHLERVYAKLNVSTRTAAVARVKWNVEPHHST